MTNANPDASHSAQQPRALRVLTAVGVLLFLAGSVLAIFLAPHVWLVALRWTGLVLIAAAGWRRSSLTYWIFFAMLLGGEIGLDRPRFAEHLRVFSDIFLRKAEIDTTINGDGELDRRRGSAERKE